MNSLYYQTETVRVQISCRNLKFPSTETQNPPESQKSPNRSTINPIVTISEKSPLNPKWRHLTSTELQLKSPNPSFDKKIDLPVKFNISSLFRISVDTISTQGPENDAVGGPQPQKLFIGEAEFDLVPLIVKNRLEVELPLKNRVLRQEGVILMGTCVVRLDLGGLAGDVGSKRLEIGRNENLDFEPKSRKSAKIGEDEGDGDAKVVQALQFQVRIKELLSRSLDFSLKKEPEFFSLYELKSDFLSLDALTETKAKPDGDNDDTNPLKNVEIGKKIDKIEKTKKSVLESLDASQWQLIYESEPRYEDSGLSFRQAVINLPKMNQKSKKSDFWLKLEFSSLTAPTPTPISSGVFNLPEYLDLRQEDLILVKTGSKKPERKIDFGGTLRLINTFSFVQIITQAPQTMLGANSWPRGVDFKISFIVDFSKHNSAAHQKSLRSLHQSGFLEPSEPQTRYQKALKAFSEILLRFEKQRTADVYGFGGELDSEKYNQTANFFPLSGDPGFTGCFKTKGILDLYSGAKGLVKPISASQLAPVLQNISKKVRSCYLEGELDYTILVILTASEVPDLYQTANALNQSSKLPMSIVVVGLGKSRFESMKILEVGAGEVQERYNYYPVRENARFVRLMDVEGLVGGAGGGVAGVEELAAAMVLREIPAQIGHFYWLKSQGIV